MDKRALLERITIDPNVMAGKPIIRGLRITVEQVLIALANEVTIKDLLEDYPELEYKDIQAVLLYASKLVHDEKIYPIAI